MLKRIGRKRIIAIILAVVVLVGSVATITLTTIMPRRQAQAQAPPSNPYQTDDSDREIAEDVSDMTGVSVYNLLEMRGSGRDWNEIIASVNQGTSSDTDISDDQLSSLIASASKEDVDYASQLVQRVLFNLREINAKDNNVATPEVPNPNDMSIKDLNTTKAEDKHDFKTLEGGFKKNVAIYLTLALKDVYGSMELALDEYLYCLQIGVDLRLYLTDKDTYDKHMAEKSPQLIRTQAVSAAVIEEKMLEQLNSAKTGKDATDGQDTAEAEAKGPDNPATDAMPEIPKAPVPKSNIPVIEDPRPKEPSSEIYDEIDKINKGTMPY